MNKEKPSKKDLVHAWFIELQWLNENYNSLGIKEVTMHRLSDHVLRRVISPRLLLQQSFRAEEVRLFTKDGTFIGIVGTREITKKALFSSRQKEDYEYFGETIIQAIHRYGAAETFRFAVGRFTEPDSLSCSSLKISTLPSAYNLGSWLRKLELEERRRAEEANNFVRGALKVMVSE